MADMDEDAKPSNQCKEFAANNTPITGASEQITCKSSGSKSVNIGEMVCVGATIVIVIFLLCIWIFYEFKDDEAGINHSP